MIGGCWFPTLMLYFRFLSISCRFPFPFRLFFLTPLNSSLHTCSCVSLPHIVPCKQFIFPTPLITKEVCATTWTVVFLFFFIFLLILIFYKQRLDWLWDFYLVRNAPFLFPPPLLTSFPWKNFVAICIFVPCVLPSPISAPVVPLLRFGGFWTWTEEEQRREST